ncbi:glycosyltransferase family 4 protein [Patescibacteria group bacterium]|nr:glycosyltransferase family 4 protein [Patescibacteria group bacterium]
MRKKLKIAMMVSGIVPVPLPKDYKEIFAPMEMAMDIANGLVKKGHKVSFFTPKGSKSKKFKVYESSFQPLYKEKITNYHEIDEKGKFSYLFEQYLICLILKKYSKEHFDIVHIHPADRALPFGYLFPKIPFVYTLHDPVSLWRKKIYRLYKTKNQYFVSISKAQQKPAPDLNWIGTVYNGIRLKPFSFNPNPKNYLLFIGRLLEKKGADTAIKIALKTKQNLIIVGAPNKGAFWEKRIKPYLKRKNIKYVGYVPYEKTYKYYGEAKAALYPIKWEEPFGLTFIEAMACGTPVIVFDRGSAREVVKDGKTGFVVKTIKGAVAAIKKIDQIDRKECRKRVEEKFSIEKMVNDYEKVYYEILKKK